MYDGIGKNNDRQQERRRPKCEISNEETAEAGKEQQAYVTAEIDGVGPFGSPKKGTQLLLIHDIVVGLVINCRFFG